MRRTHSRFTTHRRLSPVVWMAGVVGFCFLVSVEGRADNDAPPLPPSGVLAEADLRLIPEGETVPFGATVHATVTVRASAAREIRVTRIEPPRNMPGILIHSSGRLEHGTGQTGEIEWRRTFVLRMVAEGAQEIPPFEVRYRVGESRETEKLATPARKVVVTPDPLTGEAPPDELNPPAPPESIPFDWTWRNVFYASVTLAALFLGAILWWGIRRFAVLREARRPPAPPRPEHLIAYEALDALEKSTYLRDGRFKDYFSALSEILRRYTGARYDIPAPDWTTFEIQDALSGGGEPGEAALLRLVSVLDTCDLVKFARWSPPEDGGPHCMNEARRFIDATRRRADAALETDRIGEAA